MPGHSAGEVTTLTIAGGVYHEQAIWPTWNQIYGSGGRAAAALRGHVDEIDLHAYAQQDMAVAFAPYAAVFGFQFHSVLAEQPISFQYVHSLSVPTISPQVRQIQSNPPFEISAANVLRFGMMEGSAIVQAERCVYDPQSPTNPEPFARNGSQATALAIVANRGEITALAGENEPIAAARQLCAEGAAVVVVKCGPEGARVVTASGVSTVPAFKAGRIWTVGSGDVFAAHFAARWASHGDDPIRAAEIASHAVAEYVESMALPTPSVQSLLDSPRGPVSVATRRVYLASPFFTLGQRWLVDEARRCLRELGMEVFSPVHDVGAGPAEQVAPADIAGLDECDAVFAILDGLDSGTVSEVGYARALKKPVYALAQTVSEEDLKMVVGSGCHVFDDFVTAIHHTAWRT